MKSVPAKGIHWDLSDLYSSPNDPQILKDKEFASNQSQKLTDTYKKLIGESPSANIVLKAIILYEQVWEKVAIYGSYASYLHSVDTADPQIGKFYQEAAEFESTISSKLAWFDIALLEIPEKTFRLLINDTALEKYAHYLQRARTLKPFTLSEKEEVILSKKAQTSSTALVRLFDEVDSSNTYALMLDNKPKSMSYSALVPYLTTHPDRKLREDASSALMQGLKNKEKLYAFTLNTILLDKKISDEIRGYTYAQEATFLHYDIDKDTVDTMSEAIEIGYRLSEKYYIAKKKALRLKTLHEWDRYSNIHDQSSKTYTWEEAKKIVLDSFNIFSPLFYETAKKFFDNNWIHAEMTPNKRGGAYCSYNSPDKHPYILVNFAGQIRDVTTIAHELGHGIHGYLAQKNTLLEAWPSTVIAEVASIFAEMIVFEKIYNEETDEKVKINLLADKLQNIFASIFRQNAFYLFESDIHTHRREKGELTIDEFNAYFQTRLQAMFGTGLTLSDYHKNWWMTILHFYRYSFYVFCYSFGEMLSLALYGRYKKEGSAMVDDYIKALSVGGSKSPREITRIMGVDIGKKDFWQDGLDILESYVDEFIRLTKK